MSKKTSKTLFVCSDCGEEYMQWQGRCANCGNWNTIKEFSVAVDHPGARVTSPAASQKPRVLKDVTSSNLQRMPSGFAEVDRVLGGGIVPGSVILVGGDPGIGKSTLLLQVANLVKQPVLYVSGEESPEQVKLRADRLGLTGGNVSILAVTDVSQVQQVIEAEKPSLVIVDSIQTMYDGAYPSTPGSIVQVRETAMRIQQLAKKLNVSVILVGHITKEGTVAGPRTLEHLVDVVLYLEGEPSHDLRILRAAKNRFGDATETGMFVMEEKGMNEVANASSFLLQERVEAPGSVLTVVMEGSRPILIEVQALTVPTVFGNPRRTASGFDPNRLNLLLAVLQRRAGVDLSAHDVYVNIVGGLKVKEPGIDAAVCVALASARAGVSLPPSLVVVGEVGLSGELRRVSSSERREKEVATLGYTLASGSRELRPLVEKYVKKGTRGGSLVETA